MNDIKKNNVNNSIAIKQNKSNPSYISETKKSL